MPDTIEGLMADYRRSVSRTLQDTVMENYSSSEPMVILKFLRSDVPSRWKFPVRFQVGGLGTLVTVEVDEDRGTYSAGVFKNDGECVYYTTGQTRAGCIESLERWLTEWLTTQVPTALQRVAGEEMFPDA